ncbi:MAG: ECF transporter S component [Clostridia bacterium]|nr:ECF transporter S component [Clostridia bacterium]
MKKIVASALFVALIVVTTIFVKIPLATFGYVHLGDAFIFLACFVLKPKHSIVVGALGSALADLCLGYFIYIPATFVVKALVALVFAIVVYNKSTLLRQIISVVICSAIIGGGYFVFEACLYGVTASIVNVPFNLMQGAVCGVVAMLLIKSFTSIPPLKSFKDSLYS